MATYMMLFHLTGRGVQDMTDSPTYIDTAKGVFRDLGAKVKDFYMLMGHYDMVFIIESPNYEIVAKAALTLDSLGSMRTETIRAFTEDEYRKIIADLK
ncbi:MAG: GYD domain-containing protein [Dehalococcoidales bacterium]|nr:GYD domain-containing protein [Dehalococcoidales bacterium]